MISSRERIITVRQRLRPLRLTFLIDPDSRAQLLHAIELCTCRWGGMLNSIVPVYRNRPRWAAKELTARQLTQGWLDTFERDYVVESSAGSSEGLSLANRVVVPVADLTATDDDGGVSYGVSALHVYERAYEREFRFKRRHPQEAVLCTPRTKRDEVLVSALFGRFPSSGFGARLRSRYISALEADEREIHRANICDSMLMRRPSLSPLQATMWELNSRQGRRQLGLLLLFDPTSVVDVSHVWNLRALGLRFWPVPLPFADEFIEKFAHAISADGPLHGIEFNAAPVVSPAPSISNATLQAVRGRLAAAATDESLRNANSWQMLPVWDAEEMRAQRLERAEVHWQETESEVTATEKRFQFDCLRPDFGDEGLLLHGPNWTVIVNISAAALASDLAEVIPPSLGDVSRLLEAPVDRYPITTSSEGLVVRCDRLERRQYWGLVTGTRLFEFWLRSQGVDARVSAAGRTAEEFLRAIGGPLVAVRIGHPELIKMIGRAAHDPGGGRVIGYQELQGVLGRMHGGNAAMMEGHARLLNERVLQVHMGSSCPTCDQQNWYPPSDLGDELKCRRCSRTFAFPAGKPPQRRDWAYRPTGPFAVPNYAHGAYTVALALRFLGTWGLGGRSRSWSVSLEDRTAGTAFEIDFAAWVGPDVLDHGPPELVLGEAKTFNAFEPSDFARATALLGRFEQSRIVFATLKEKLSDDERLGLQKLADRRRGSAWPNRGRLIVLTRTELCEQVALAMPLAWRKAGGQYERVAHEYPDAGRGLSELSDATLDLHAGWRWPTTQP